MFIADFVILFFYLFCRKSFELKVLQNRGKNTKYSSNDFFFNRMDDNADFFCKCFFLSYKLSFADRHNL